MENPFEYILTSQRRLENKVDRLMAVLSKLKVDSNDEMSITKAADYLNYAKGTIYQLVSRGEIPYSKRGRKLLFSREELSTWRVEKGLTNDDLDEEISKMIKSK